ncbi:KpsF/GutQ family sugar-phosphate isomerase [Brucella pseudogrignonensis]|uniref:KpsF/GutQ family sugar-phosphate isomerase n=1 Tax=Brucella pseudogrignonensis TaxID=419475 RepID=UPI003ECCD18B
MENLNTLSKEESKAGSLRDICKNAIKAEGLAVCDFAEQIDDNFSNAVQLMANARGHVVVAGIGKSGHIARKIASTLRSMGKPAVFLHASEASHGDLGLVGSDSTCLIFSNSGETSELSDLIFYCEAHNIPIVAVTASKESTLGKCAKYTIAYGKVEEVCPNGLAPTTSTTLSLAIGDGLAVGIAQFLGATSEDFRRYHPGGKLGAKLLRVRDLMHVGDALPLVSLDTPMNEVVIKMSEKGFGIAIVTSDEGITGVITDGDMRRRAGELWRSSARDMILGKPLTISEDSYAFEALELMTAKSVTCLVVENGADNRPGIIHIHDCLRARVQ